MPAHGHNAHCNSGPGNKTKPNANFWASDGAGILSEYAPAPDGNQMSPQALGLAGNNQPHNNIQPYLTLNFCIALQGIYPARS
jgi:microcystin-dependent protein